MDKYDTPTLFARPLSEADFDLIVNARAKYGFVILDRLVGEMKLGSFRVHHIIMSEAEIGALRGFRVSQTEHASDGCFLTRPVIGAILDRDFITSFPKVVAQLANLIPHIDGSDPIFNVSENYTGFLDWQLSRAFGISESIIADLGARHVEVGRLQQMLQDQLEVLQEAQRVVDQATTPKPRVGVYLPPSEISLHPNNMPNIKSISQNSKREFSSVYAFEVHIAEVADDIESTTVVVNLRAAHSQNVLATWTVSTQSIEPGWYRFDCPLMSRSVNEPVLIEINWKSGSVPRLAFSLGEITADPRLKLMHSDGSTNERSLAVRIYSGVPGLRLPSHGWGKLSDDCHAFERPRQVIIDDLLARAEYFAGLPAPRLDLLRYVDEKTGLLLHPVDDAVHVAVIRNVRIDDVYAITADVTLAHDEAADIEFGMFASPADMPVTLEAVPNKIRQTGWLRLGKSFAKSDKTPDATNFQDEATWLRLKSREVGQVVFETAEKNLGDNFNIFIATRQVGSGTHYAMAHFIHLSVLRGNK